MEQVFESLWEFNKAMLQANNRMQKFVKGHEYECDYVSGVYSVYFNGSPLIHTRDAYKAMNTWDESIIALH